MVQKDMEWINVAQDMDKTLAVCCECGNKTSGSIKCGEFLDWLGKSY